MYERHSTIPDNAELVFTGEIFDVFQWPQELYDGSMATFEKLRRPDTAVVIPITQEGKVLLVEEEQPGWTRSLDFPAGRMEPAEEPEAAAKRELLEETGYQAGSLRLLESSQPVHKIDWNVYVYIAYNCVKIAEQNLDPGEKITTKLMEVDDVIQAICDETLAHSVLEKRVLRAKAGLGSMDDLIKLFCNP